MHDPVLLVLFFVPMFGWESINTNSTFTIDRGMPGYEGVEWLSFSIQLESSY